MAGSGLFHPRARGDRGGELLDRDPAAERHRRRCTWGTRYQDAIEDALIRRHRMTRPADQVDPRDRPRRDRDPDPGRARCSRRRGPAARRSGARRFEQRVWQWREQYGGQIIEQLKRLGASCDYDDERFTLDPAVRGGRDPGVRRAVREGLHLPRPLHGQLGSGQPLGDLRPRGRGPRGHRHALLHRLPARLRRRT